MVEGGAALTDAQFVGLRGEYPDMRMEKPVDGDIVMMPPVDPRTGRRNAAITHQLFAWTERDGQFERPLG